MSETLKFISSNGLLLAANIILIVLLFVTFALLIKSATEHNALAHINRILQKNASTRTEKEEFLRKEEGAQEKENLFYRLDLTINRSGIKRKIPFFSAEYLILICGLLAIIAGIIVTLFGGLFKGIIAAVVVGLAPAVVIIVKSSRGYKKTEAQLIHFLNLVENYSKTEDNLVTIFGKVYPFLQEPLRTAVMECYTEAGSTGDVSMAFRKLEVACAHEKFSEILRNLELCSNYEANYEVVASTSRDIMINYTRSKKKISSIAKDAAVELVVLAVITGVLMVIVGSFIGGSLITFLLNSTAGIGILIYLGAVTVYAIFSVLKLFSGSSE